MDPDPNKSKPSNRPEDASDEIEAWVKNCGSLPSTPNDQTIIRKLKEKITSRPTTTPPGNDAKFATRQIDAYVLTQMIGEGGMGTVWLAEQREPIQRTVAIKLVRPGFSKHVSRLKVERQSLAVMNHPNIAQIFDAGTTEDGQPYFVMEYIEGKGLVEHCHEHQLSLPARLNLFIKVCDAIEHAHSKGIIHRDLKPSNIMVAEPKPAVEPANVAEPHPIVKVIDFGLAKTNSFEIRDEKDKTAERTILGSPRWMSPEQARGIKDNKTLTIDSRTDIYSLGAILYQLITGTTPIDEATLDSHSDLKILELIQEQVPPKPSVRLQTKSPSIFSEIVGLVDRDIDLVVMKALEKDPDRRYQRPQDLAADINRFLSNEAITASPPSTPYRIKKFVQRNWIGTIFSAVLLITIIAGILFTSGFANWAFREKSKANSANILADKKTLEAEAAIQRATEFETDLNELDSLLLTSLDRFSTFHDSYTFEKKNPPLLESIEKELSNRKLSPRRQLAILSKLATVWYSYGEFKKAATILEPINSDRGDRISKKEKFDRTWLNAMRTYARCQIELGQYAESTAHLEWIVDCFKDNVSNDNDLIRSKSALAACYLRSGQAAKSIKLCESTLSQSLENVDKALQLELANILAMAYAGSGDFHKAIEICETELVNVETMVPDRELVVIGCQHTIARIYQQAGRSAVALKIIEEMLARCEAKFGFSHRRTLELMRNKAGCLKDMKRDNEAAQILESALELSKDALGISHGLTLGILNDLAFIKINNGQIESGVECVESLLETTRASFGENHPATLRALNSLGLAQAYAGQQAIATKTFSDCLTRQKHTLGPSHELVFLTTRNLSNSQFSQGNLSLGFETLRTFLAAAESELGEGHITTVMAKLYLARAFQKSGQPQKCVELCQQAMNQPVVEFKGNDLNAISLLTDGLLSQNKFDEARQLFKKYDPLIKDAAQNRAPVLDAVLINLAEVHLEFGEYNEADKIARKLFQRRNADPEIFFRALSIYGYCQFANGQFDRAKGALTRSHSYFQQRHLAMPGVNFWYELRTVDRLVDFHDVRNDAANAALWQKKLDALKKELRILSIDSAAF